MKTADSTCEVASATTKNIVDMNISHAIETVILPGMEEFLELFPHRYDYIFSSHGIQPQWKTETRHPLHNSLIQQAAEIFGVRFGTTTRYAMLDIDSGSPYHPRADKLAIDRMVAALEPLGIVASCKITSSYSQGLHIYLPLAGSFKTWEIATAIDVLLRAAGFQICKGWLEIFPNQRATPDQLYNAHRLPMQSGSYVLGQDYDRIGHSHWDFVSSWRWAEARNEVTEGKLSHVLKFYRRRKYTITSKGAKFLQDLDAEIEIGWTGHHQTNLILGRIAMRGRVFGHLLEGTDDPLTLRQLIKYVVTTAKSLPGYEEFCRHRPEIERKAEMWARSAMAKYWPYAIGKTDSPAADRQDLRSSNPWNKLQRELARDRIRFAIRELVESDQLPDGVLDRVAAIKKFGVGGETLYQHLELWHPRFITAETVKIQAAHDFGGDCVPDGHSKGGLGDSDFLDHPDRCDRRSIPPKIPDTPSSLLGDKGRDLPPVSGLERLRARLTRSKGRDLPNTNGFSPNT